MAVRPLIVRERLALRIQLKRLAGQDIHLILKKYLPGWIAKFNAMRPGPQRKCSQFPDRARVRVIHIHVRIPHFRIEFDLTQGRPGFDRVRRSVIPRPIPAVISRAVKCRAVESPADKYSRMSRSRRNHNRQRHSAIPEYFQCRVIECLLLSPIIAFHTFDKNSVHDRFHGAIIGEA